MNSTVVQYYKIKKLTHVHVQMYMYMYIREKCMYMQVMWNADGIFLQPTQSRQSPHVTGVDPRILATPSLKTLLRPCCVTKINRIPRNTIKFDMIFENLIYILQFPISPFSSFLHSICCLFKNLPNFL